MIRPPRARKVLGTEEDEATAAFADTEGVALSWSIAEIPKPWKNPLWQRDTSKRTKNIKQVMGLERDRSAVHPPGPSRVHPKLAKAPQDPEAEAKLEPEEQEKALAVRQALDTEGKPVMPMANCELMPSSPLFFPLFFFAHAAIELLQRFCYRSTSVSSAQQEVLRRDWSPCECARLGGRCSGLLTKQVSSWTMVRTDTLHRAKVTAALRQR